jgi:multiple sugar transport system substrate-binding protein
MPNYPGLPPSSRQKFLQIAGIDGALASTIGIQRSGSQGSTRSPNVQVSLIVFNFFALITSAIAGLAFAGTAFSQSVELNVAMEAGRMADAAGSVVPAFEAQNPGIKVNIVPLPYTTFQQKVTTELSAGSGAYDVIEAHALMLVPLVGAKQVLPLDAPIKKSGLDMSDFLKSQLNLGTLWGKGRELNPQGEIYGLPYNSDVFLFVYRKDLFNELGIKPTDSWEDLVKDFKLITEKKHIAAYAFSGARRDNSHLIYDFYNIALNLGGTLPLGESFKPAMNSAGNAKALSLLAEIVKSGAAPKGVEEYRYDDKNTAIAQGLAAVMSQWMLACYKSVDDPAKSKVAGKIGYATPPGGKACTGGWVVSIVATTKHPEEAFKFISFLTNQANNLKLAIEYCDGPVRTSVVSSAEFKQAYPFSDAMLTALNNGTNYIATAPQLAVWSEITDVITDRLADAIFGSTAPEAALKQADEQIAGVLRQSGYLH